MDLDPLTLDIMRRNLISTVEEMARTTTRTAYSTVFSEGLDFSCAIFDPAGKMIAQAAGVPGHVGGLADLLVNVFEHYPRFRAGDVIIHNDPYGGGSHQPDVGIVRPIFYGATMMGFAVNRGNWVDIGGMNAGGWGGGARHVIQEALIIPATKLYNNGKLVREIRDFVLRNVRLPEQAWGDLQAQIASAIVAERRVGSLCERYGTEAVHEAGRQAVRYSRDRFHKMMVVIPDGEYHAEDFMENDGHSTEKRLIRVKVSKKGTDLRVDFTGTCAQVRAPINVTLAGTKAAVYTALINVVDPDVPINSGCLDVVDVIAPLGSMVNPTYPAPVLPGFSDTCIRICETVFLALAEVLPERVAAGSFGAGNCTTGCGFRAEGNEEFLWYSFGSGGCGARSFADGNSAEWYAMANCRAESVEIWENRYPLRVIDYRLRVDSGGPGQWRGGLGFVKAFELLEDTDLSACVDRNLLPPYGLAGGSPGTCNALSLEIDGEEKDFVARFGLMSPSKFSNLRAPKGAIYRVYSGGGGGFGPPMQRPVDAVLADVRAGYVSVAGARQQYGVAIETEALIVDDDETARMRQL